MHIRFPLEFLASDHEEDNWHIISFDHDHLGTHRSLKPHLELNFQLSIRSNLLNR